MRAAFPLFLSFTCAFLCAGQTPATAQYQDLPGIAERYDNGYLFAWNNPSYTQVAFYSRDTKPAFTVAEHKDGIYHVAWAVDSDGVAAGVYQPRHLWEGRIDLLDASGKIIRTINTGSYVPQHIVFGSDHTIWTVGFYAENDGSQDFNAVHHYARTGEELGQALLWSQMTHDDNSYTALQALVGGRRLYVANDRIGFVAPHRGHSTWIELSFSGFLLGKYELGTYQDVEYQPVAMTAGSGVYAAIYKDRRFDGWAALDRSTGVWQTLAGYPQGKIVGSDADNLVFSKPNGDSTVLQFVPAASLPLTHLKQRR